MKITQPVFNKPKVRSYGHAKSARAHFAVHHKPTGFSFAVRPFTATLERIRNGIPLSEFNELTQRLGLTKEDFARKIGISAPTLSRRKKTHTPLDPEHSDRLMRYDRLYSKAVELFDGNEADARAWLHREEPALDYHKPIDVAETEAGAREVENVIGRLEYGELT
jgi:putative toxin-antitoxin system antitoxin component (TIGR02293 family)